MNLEAIKFKHPVRTTEIGFESTGHNNDVCESKNCEAFKFNQYEQQKQVLKVQCRFFTRIWVGISYSRFGSPSHIN
jgi:hypothetical protein